MRLAQVFSNLMINASKFTHEYGRRHRRATRRQQASRSTVSDDGVGMPPELQPFIFDLFTQGFRSLDRAQGGLGIGLSLVRTITQMHGGSVTAESAGSGQGSQFHRQPAAVARRPAPTTRRRCGRRRRRRAASW